MPVRRIPRNYRSLTGIHAAGDGGRGIAFESSLERDFITLHSFDPDVAEIEEQPVAIRYPMPSGRSTRYTPDFLVRYRSGRRPCLFEVKYRAVLEKNIERLRPGFEAAEVYVSERGWAFRIFTEDDLRSTRLKNVQFLRPFRHTEVDAGRCARIVKLLERNGPTPVSELLETAWPDRGERAFGTHCLWYLVSRRRVVTDLDLPLTDESVIDLPEPEEADDT